MSLTLGIGRWTGSAVARIYICEGAEQVLANAFADVELERFARLARALAEVAKMRPPLLPHGKEMGGRLRNQRCQQYVGWLRPPLWGEGRRLRPLLVAHARVAGIQGFWLVILSMGSCR